MLHPGDPRKRNSLLIFHGNAGNIGHRLPELMSFFDRLEMNIFAIDYRGYGNSEGVPSEQGIALDAQVALDFMLNHPEIDPRRVFLYGSSLGGAVAIRLAHLCSQKVYLKF